MESSPGKRRERILAEIYERRHVTARDLAVSIGVSEATVRRDLKSLAMELQIPVIAASQLRRPPAGSSAKEPKMEDLKESGGIEQNADLVVLLYRPEVDKPRDPDVQGKAIMDIAKNRNGRIDKFRLWWACESTRFMNPDSDEAMLP